MSPHWEAGWTFDEKKAAKFYAELAQERAELQQELDELFLPWIVEEEFIPKANNRKLGYTKGEPFMKQKGPVNPNSRSTSSFACGKNTDGSRPSLRPAVTQRSTKAF